MPVFDPDQPTAHHHYTMQYNPTAKRPSNLLPPGIYPATIEEATETTSQVKPDGTGGNPMLKLNLMVYVGAEGRRYIKDYIVIGGANPQDWKLAHLMEAARLPLNGELNPADLVGKTVTVKVKIKPARGKFEESNGIDDYKDLPADGEPQARAAAKAPQVPTGPVDDANSPPF